MAVRVSSNLETKNPLDKYATHLGNLTKGGVHTKDSISAMNSIPVERRSRMMLCVVADIGDGSPALYWLNTPANPTKAQLSDNQYWQLVPLGSSIEGVLSLKGFQDAGSLTILDSSGSTGDTFIVESGGTVTNANIFGGATVELTVGDYLVYENNKWNLIPTGATSVTWNTLAGKPSTFTPSPHTHVVADITDFPDLSSYLTNAVKTSTITESTQSTLLPTVQAIRDYVNGITAAETAKYIVSDINNTTDVKAITTIGLELNSILLYRDSSDGSLSGYKLVAGTNADNPPTVLRPDDYAASTNEKIWRQIAISGDGGGSFVLADGNGTTANGSSVDLGGIITTQTILDDIRSGTSKVGVELNGFGETDNAGTGADYSTLLGISLVPKKYVIDYVAQELQPIQNTLASDVPTLDTFQELVDEVQAIRAITDTLDTDGELRTAVDNAVGGTWWRVIDNTNFDALTETNPQSLWEEIDGKIATANSDLSTGILSGLEVSVNSGDNSLFDVAPGVGLIVNNLVSPAELTTVTFPGATGVTVTNLATEENTDLAIDGNGNIIQRGGAGFSNAEFRTLIPIGGIDHNNNTTISNTFNFGTIAYGIGNQLRDLAQAVGDITLSGNSFSANGVNLQLNYTGGDIFAYSENRINNINNPNIVTTQDETGFSFLQIFNDGTGTATVNFTNTIDPDFYDDGSGTLVAVPQNDWTIKKLYIFPNSGTKIVQYGEATYDTQEEALDNITRETITTLEGFQTAFLRGYLIVQEGATDLSDPSEAEFRSAGRFGDLQESTGSGSVVNDSNFKVLKGPSVQSVFADVDEELLQRSGTGIYYGGIVTNAVGTSSVDISAGEGQIVDVTDPANKTFTRVTWSAKTNFSITVTNPVTLLYFDDNSDTLKVQIGIPSVQQRRSRIYIAALACDGTQITDVVYQRDWVGQDVQQIRDVARILGEAKLNGFIVSPNGANRSLNITNGTLFDFGAGEDPTNPHFVDVTNLGNLVSFDYLIKNGTVTSAGVTLIDPNNYDNNNTLTTIANNNWSVQQLYVFKGGRVAVVYDQFTYNTKQAARDSILTVARVAPPQVAGGVRAAFIVVKQGATNLLNTDQAVLVPTNKFGEVGGGIGSDSGALLKVNNLSDVNSVVAARDNLSVLSETESNNKYLQILNNLSDLNDPSIARTNLSVYSSTEVDGLLGTAASKDTGTSGDAVPLLNQNAIFGELLKANKHFALDYLYLQVTGALADDYVVDKPYFMVDSRAQDTVINSVNPNLSDPNNRGQLLIIQNYNFVNNLIIKHQGTGTAGNKFSNPLGRDINLGVREAAIYIYDLNGWALIATTETKEDNPDIVSNTNLGATPVIDLSTGDVIKKTMDQSISNLTFTNGVEGQVYKVYITIDSTGGYDFEYDYASVETQDGIELLLPSDANTKHLYQVEPLGNGKYFIQPIYNIYTPQRTYDVAGQSITLSTTFTANDGGITIS